MTFDGSAYKSTLKEATIVLSNGEVPDEKLEENRIDSKYLIIGCL